MERYEKNQKTFSDLWEKHQHNAITDDEGVYVNLGRVSAGGTRDWMLATGG